MKAPPGDNANIPENGQAENPPAVSEDGPALYYATIQDGFYVSTQASALRGLTDRLAEVSQGVPAVDPPIQANMMAYAAPRAAEKIRPTASVFLEHQGRQVCWRNLVQVWLLGRCGLLEDASVASVAPRFLGYGVVCPDGGRYRFDAVAGEAVCSVHGRHVDPMRLDAPPPDSPIGRLLDEVERVTAQLRFTPEGLATQVSIQRRGS